MASRKILRLHSDSAEGRESRFQESDLIHSTSQRTRRRTSFDRTVSVACVFYLGLLVVFVALLFIVAMGVRFSGIHNQVTYPVTLGDTQLVSFDNFWCESITVSSNSVGPPLRLSIYLLYQQPSLTAYNYFTITERFSIDQTASRYANLYGWNDYRYASEGDNFVSWQFHFYPGSVFTLDACVQSGDAKFVLIQGPDNFQKWAQSREEVFTLQLDLPPCSSGMGFSSIDHVLINKSDEYFFVFISLGESPPQLDLIMTFNRTEYSVKEFRGLPNCTITSNQDEECWLFNPMYAYYSALLVANSSKDLTKNLTYGTFVDFQWSCNPRGVSYAIVFFVPFFVFAIAGCVIVCFYLNKKRRVASYEMIETSRATTGAPGYSHLPPPPPYTPSGM